MQPVNIIILQFATGKVASFIILPSPVECVASILKLK